MAHIIGVQIGHRMILLINNCRDETRFADMPEGHQMNSFPLGILVYWLRVYSIQTNSFDNPANKFENAGEMAAKGFPECVNLGSRKKTKTKLHWHYISLCISLVFLRNRVIQLCPTASTYGYTGIYYGVKPLIHAHIYIGV